MVSIAVVYHITVSYHNIISQYHITVSYHNIIS